MFNFINQLRCLLLITLLSVITACGSDSDPYYVTEVQLTATQTTFADGESQLVEGIAIYSTGEELTASSGNSIWTSQDDKIATVDYTGLVTGVSPGTTIIYASYSGSNGSDDQPVTGSISITITEASLVGIKIYSVDNTVPNGLNVQYTAVGIYSNGTEDNLANNSEMHWDSEFTDIAEIDSITGLADTQKKGETTISVTFQGLSSSTELTVTDESLVSIAISPVEGQTSVVDGYKLSFTAEATYTDDSKVIVTNDVTWHSTNSVKLNPSVPNGTFEGIEPSIEDVTATLDLKTSNAIAVTVTDALLVSVVIKPQEVTYPMGLNKNLIATGLFSDGTERDIAKEESVNWESLNEDVAKIDNNGLLTPVDNGTAEIRVTTEDDSIFDTEFFVITEAELTATIVITPKDLLLAPGESRLFIATGLYTDGEMHILNGKKGISWSLSDDDNSNYDDGVSIGNSGIIKNDFENTRAITKQLEVNVLVDGFYNSDITYTNVAAVKVLSAGGLSFVSPFSVTDAALLGMSSSTYQRLPEDGVSGPEGVDFIILTQISATTECANLVYNRHDDYRLPTSSELMSLWTRYDNSDDEDYQLYTEQKWSVGEYFWTSESSDVEGSFKVFDLRKGLEGEVSVNENERYFSCVRDTVLP
ncbi:hypothetical protein ESZ36_20165 [Colwellia demingiae]|uniref:BIG2 domain-containing protein n=1 Tax=Colwellia demingiae TaxID=89401 RepID=A0A5C6Q660_9GAMM|nr:Ig-like domain-containing protein [Colwellia demingiae]TWX64292.1 hypothetical protein ESZ36_20165 [Colwellia demingiae]